MRSFSSSSIVNIHLPDGRTISTRKKHSILTETDLIELLKLLNCPEDHAWFILSKRANKRHLIPFPYPSNSETIQTISTKEAVKCCIKISPEYAPVVSMIEDSFIANQNNLRANEDDRNRLGALLGQPDFIDRLLDYLLSIPELSAEWINVQDVNGQRHAIGMNYDGLLFRKHLGEISIIPWTDVSSPICQRNSIKLQVNNSLLLPFLISPPPPSSSRGDDDDNNRSGLFRRLRRCISLDRHRPNVDRLTSLPGQALFRLVGDSVADPRELLYRFQLAMSGGSKAGTDSQRPVDNVAPVPTSPIRRSMSQRFRNSFRSLRNRLTPRSVSNYDFDQQRSAAASPNHPLHQSINQPTSPPTAINSTGSPRRLPTHHAREDLIDMRGPDTFNLFACPVVEPVVVTAAGEAELEELDDQDQLNIRSLLISVPDSSAVSAAFQPTALSSFEPTTTLTSFGVRSDHSTKIETKPFNINGSVEKTNEVKIIKTSSPVKQFDHQSAPPVAPVEPASSTIIDDLQPNREQASSSFPTNKTNEACHKPESPAVNSSPSVTTNINTEQLNGKTAVLDDCDKNTFSNHQELPLEDKPMEAKSALDPSVRTEELPMINKTCENDNIPQPNADASSKNKLMDSKQSSSETSPPEAGDSSGIQRSPKSGLPTPTKLPTQFQSRIKPPSITSVQPMSVKSSSSVPKSGLPSPTSLPSPGLPSPKIVAPSVGMNGKSDTSQALPSNIKSNGHSLDVNAAVPSSTPTRPSGIKPPSLMRPRDPTSPSSPAKPSTPTALTPSRLPRLETSPAPASKSFIKSPSVLSSTTTTTQHSNGNNNTANNGHRRPSASGIPVPSGIPMPKITPPSKVTTVSK